MDKQRLLELLKGLHSELEATESVDAESDELLRTVMTDIHRLLDNRGEAPSDQGKTINERMKKIAVQFEADHPRLSMTMNEVMDALNKMGI
ncbi:MAG: DUF4404 family protein [Gammaproteobacteria bacterium]|nr:DUF4404 family protein [Gammaproteobacteria bacterium]